ncbi:hypothetical protein SEA_CECE_180 [Microbacterium phage Cece]|nr:hypothetical protein SEA_CECE_180 [Microbacterium phage Cece]
MTAINLFTMKFSFGIEGLDDGTYTDTLDVTWDPELSDEQNQAVLQMKVQLFQAKMGLGLNETFGTRVPQLMVERLEAAGLDPNELLG